MDRPPLPEPYTLAQQAAKKLERTLPGDDLTPVIEAMREYAAAVSAHDNVTLLRHLGNMLAVLHGDGGHYLDEHGVDKAVADALTRYYSKLEQADAWHASLQIISEGVRIDGDGTLSGDMCSDIALAALKDAP